MDVVVHRRADASTPESEAWVDAEHAGANVSYDYWIAWLRWYECEGDRSAFAAHSLED